MIVSNYQYGYHDEFSRTHVVVPTEKGYMTFSYDILIRYHKIRKNKPESIYIKDHPYIGKTFIGEDGKERTVKSVVRHFGFGDYYVALSEDDAGSSSTFTLLREGSSFYEKRYSEDASKFIEDQLNARA